MSSAGWCWGAFISFLPLNSDGNSWSSIQKAKHCSTFKRFPPPPFSAVHYSLTAAEPIAQSLGIRPIFGSFRVLHGDGYTLWKRRGDLVSTSVYVQLQYQKFPDTSSARFN
ncbi:hypothetical protein HRI_001542400 [Hibiscus trionum]|uniref:Secreted protein n=1 Tax=Hibiscus trionum TaxID=183268 RepID=A0A9W7HKC4_HIBTR|nr:hypothetical protein HRI_001542400 [Hibiscus trionum]